MTLENGTSENGSGRTATGPVRFHVTAERMNAIELGDFLDIQDNPRDARALAAFVSKFIVDEKGNYLPDDAARIAVRRVTIGQMFSVFERVSDGMGQTVPNE